MVAQEQVSEWSTRETPLASVIVRTLNMENACSKRPMAHGGDHILPDAKECNRIFIIEYCVRIAVPMIEYTNDLIVSLLEPPVPKRKGFVARKLELVPGVIEQARDHGCTGLEEGAS
jgi:hypothetical protein